MCGRRGLWSCCGGCIAPLLPACGEGGVSPLTTTEVDLALQFLGNKPSPPLNLVLGWIFFFNFKCTSRKPSFMAIIAELITLWRLQTCVISIFPSSHLAHRLENASMGRVNLATAQPSPFSPVTLLQTFPVLVLSPTPQCCSPAGTLRCFSCSPRSSFPLCSLRESGIPSPPEAAGLGQARTWQVLLLPVQMTPHRSLVTSRDQQKLFCNFKPSTK